MRFNHCKRCTANSKIDITNPLHKRIIFLAFFSFVFPLCYFDLSSLSKYVILVVPFEDHLRNLRPQGLPGWIFKGISYAQVGFTSPYSISCGLKFAVSIPHSWEWKDSWHKNEKFFKFFI